MINDDGQAQWAPDKKYLMETSEVLDRAKMELNDGILQKFHVLRTRQLEKQIAEQCYQKKKFTIGEAEQCEDFYFKNDYKLNQIERFWDDHIPKHLIQYQGCVDHAMTQKTNLEKERVFADCHNHWVKDFKQNKTQDMELRARQLLGKNLE